MANLDVRRKELADIEGIAEILDKLETVGLEQILSNVLDQQNHDAIRLITSRI
jgi:hypothetical protein